MMRRFINWLISLIKSFNKIKNSTVVLPKDVAENEKLCRAIFSPINVDNKGNLKSNSFRTPPEKDEVSVNRLDYTNSNYCKSEAKKNENPHKDRNYYGFAIIQQIEILTVGCNTIYSPIAEPLDSINPFHADIKIGYVPKKGEELPSRFRKKVDDMVKYARFYKDPEPNTNNWVGKELN